MNMHTNVDRFGNSPEQANYGLFHVILNPPLIVLHHSGEFPHLQIILLALSSLSNRYKFEKTKCD